MKKKYTLLDLGCAHCAAKMENKINQLEGIEEAVISYPNQLLIITAEDPDRHLHSIQEICSSIESQVKVIPRDIQASECTHVHKTNRTHDHSCSHTMNHDHTTDTTSNQIKKEEKKEILPFAIGILLAIIAYLGGYFLSDENMRLILYLIAYLFLAKNILISAFHNIGKGQIFDENFLMVIATLGAFLIGEYPEALGVILFYRIGESFEDYAVEKSRASIMETLNMRPETVMQVHGDHTHEIPAKDAMPDMVLLIRPGDRIPLDGIVIEGNTMIDTSALTGEPVPITVSEGDEVLSGCFNQTGVIKLKVKNSLKESMVTRIMESMENASANKPKMERFITRFSRIYTPFVVAIALMTAIVPVLFGGNFEHWLYTACTFLVISCPCALVLSVPLSFFSGIGRGSKQGILFKGGSSLEALTHIKAVILDKTGTITEGNFILQSICPYEDWDKDLLLAYAAACEQNSSHPIAKSILSAATQAHLSLPTPSDTKEIAGYGIKATINDTVFLCGNEKLMLKYGISIPDKNSDYGTEIFLAADNRAIGRLIISDTIKEDSASSVEQLNQSVKTIMLTGDSKSSAAAIAKKVGIDEYYAKLLPDDKLNVLQSLRKQYGPVMFVGDGINDAPVLAGADCSASMGNGADAAIEASDIVFMTSRLSAIPEAIRIAKLTHQTVIQNIIFALSIKFLVLLLGLLGIASMWMAVFADTGVAMICIIHSIRILRK